MYPALRKGEGREERASEHGAMYHIYQRRLNRTVPHLMLPCDLQMSGTGRQICGRWQLVITASTNMRRAWR